MFQCRNIHFAIFLFFFAILVLSQDVTPASEPVAINQTLVSTTYTCLQTVNHASCDIDNEEDIRNFFKELPIGTELDTFQLYGNLPTLVQWDTFYGYRFANFYMDTPLMIRIGLAAFQNLTYSAIRRFVVGSDYVSRLTAQNLFDVINYFPVLEYASLNIEANARLFPFMCRNSNLQELSFSFTRSISVFYINSIVTCQKLTYVTFFRASVAMVIFEREIVIGPMPTEPRVISINIDFCNLTSNHFLIYSMPMYSYNISMANNDIRDLRPFQALFGRADGARTRLNLHANPLDCKDAEHVRWVFEKLWEYRDDIYNANCESGGSIWDVTTIDEKIDEIIEDLTNITDTTNNKPIEKPTDLIDLVGRIDILVDRIANLTAHVNLTTAQATVNLTSYSLNNVIESATAWRAMNILERRQTLSTMLNTNDNMARLMNVKHLYEMDNVFTDDPQPLEVNQTEIKLSSFAFSARVFSLPLNGQIQFDLGRIKLNISVGSLPEGIAMFFDETGSESANITNLTLSASLAMMVNMSSYLTVDGEHSYNAPLVSLVVGNRTNLIELNGTGSSSEAFTIRFSHDQKIYFGERQQCVFWDIDRGDWSSRGCHYRKTSSSRYSSLCQCDHLCSLTVLTDVTNSERPDTGKTILTAVFLSLSIVFTCAALFIAFYYNKEPYTMLNDQFRLKANRFWINAHIMFWLAVSHIIILVGLDRTENAATCQAISIVLLFSLLTTFTFILLQTINFYLSIVRPMVANLDVTKYLLIGYIMPVFIILISSLLIFLTETRDIFKAFIGEYFCWISSSEFGQNIWIFVAPMTVFLLINLFLLVHILRTIFGVSCSTGGNQERQSRLHTISVVILVFNFGIPWLLYVFYINEVLAFYFTYIFIIVNGSQGITLFLDQLLYYRQKQRLRNIYRPSIIQAGKMTKSTDFSSGSNSATSDKR